MGCPTMGQGETIGLVGFGIRPCLRWGNRGHQVVQAGRGSPAG